MSLKYSELPSACLDPLSSPRVNGATLKTNLPHEQLRLLQLLTDDPRATSQKHIPNINPSIRRLKPPKPLKPQAYWDRPEILSGELRDAHTPVPLEPRVSPQNRSGTHSLPLACDEHGTTAVSTQLVDELVGEGV